MEMSVQCFSLNCLRNKFWFKFNYLAMTNTKIKEKQQFFGKVKYLTPRFESKKDNHFRKI